MMHGLPQEAEELRLYPELIPPAGLAADPGNESPFPTKVGRLLPAAFLLVRRGADGLVEQQGDVRRYTADAVGRRGRLEKQALE